MDDRLTAQETAMRVVRGHRMRGAGQKLCKLGWYAAKRGRVDLLDIIGPKNPEIRPA
jgi:hypothetical protein